MKFQSLIGFLAIMGSFSVAHAADIYSENALTVFQTTHSEQQSEMRAEFESVGLDEADLSAAELTYKDGVVTVTDTRGVLNERHLAYLGLRLGFPFVLGLNATYINMSPNGTPLFNIDLEAATVLFVNTVNVGFGYHPFGNSFYVGGRLHRITILELFDSNGVDNRPGAGVEFGWMWQLGQNKTWLASLKIGAMGFQTSDYSLKIVPDVKIGIAVKLFGTN